MRSRIPLFLVFCTFIINATPGVWAQQSDETPTPMPHPLIEILELVPSTAATPPPDRPLTITYVDFRAVESAAGLTSPTDREAFSTLDGEARDRWNIALSRVQLTPGFVVNNTYQRIEEMPELVGFDWFDIDRALTFDSLPHAGLILGGRFDHDAIGMTLADLEYGVATFKEIDIWNWGGDGMTDISMLQPANPFGGDVGWSTRIALMPGYIADGVFWDVTGDIVRTHRSIHRSLADDDAFYTLAEAIIAQEGNLVQAAYYGADDAQPSLPEPPPPPDDPEATPEPFDDPTAGYDDLPGYDLVAVADVQQGNQQVHLVALLYADHEQAAAAAEELAERLAGFDPENVQNRLDITYDEPAVFISDSTGYAVALVAARYPYDPEARDAVTGVYLPPGQLLGEWVRALQQGAFYPLWVD